MKLSALQSKALNNIARYSVDGVRAERYHASTINALMRRGLIETKSWMPRIDRSRGWFREQIVRVTDVGLLELDRLRRAG